MERPEFLIDSNAIIDFLGGNIPEKGMDFMREVVSQIPCISVISKIEILGFEALPENDKTLKSFVSDSIVLSLNEGAAERAINLRRKKKIDLTDAIIAATVLDNEFILITRNIRGFRSIAGLKCIHPHSLN